MTLNQPHRPRPEHSPDDLAAELVFLSHRQRAALQPCSADRGCLPKHLVRWHTKPGHRFPSLRLNCLGYAVRAYLEGLN